MEKFTVVLERGEDGWWVASCLEVPEAITQVRPSKMPGRTSKTRYTRFGSEA
ncbi:MAG: hypothetical protein H0T57_15885 [Rubrobacter sp.]|nr:hypothetical protein [Rubrobacter sp.]